MLRKAGGQTEKNPADRKASREIDSLPFCLLSASGQTESVSQSNSESDSRSSFSLLGS